MKAPQNRNGHKIISAFFVFALLLLCARVLLPSSLGQTERTVIAQDPVVRAVQKALPSVVNIGTTRIVTRQVRDPFDELFSQFFGRPHGPAIEERQEIQSLGSGVIVESSGYIITNEHVVARASKITVQLADNSEYEATYLTGDMKHDLALLKIQPKQPLQAIELALGRDLLLGETLIALGNPYRLGHTVTKGVLSAKNRKAIWEGKIVFEDILQTDAAINPGNSGGALVDLNGQLVGVNVAILAEAHGIGFAIPVKRVAAMLEDWFQLEKSKKVWLGLTLASRPGQLAIASVQSGSPAANAGLKQGDIVARIDGVEFLSVLDAQKRLLQKNAGDTVPFVVRRGGQMQTIPVKLVPLPKPNGFQLARDKFGISLQEITTTIGNRLMLTAGRGLLVSDVTSETEATRMGLSPGMVILGVNGYEVNRLDSLGEILKDIRTGEKVSFTVYVRSHQGRYILERTVNIVLTAR